VSYCTSRLKPRKKKRKKSWPTQKKKSAKTTKTPSVVKSREGTGGLRVDPKDFTYGKHPSKETVGKRIRRTLAAGIPKKEKRGGKKQPPPLLSPIPGPGSRRGVQN